ncbi:hypothetical protein SLOPH_1749 [Spraguea lophii 42_110]|uniref:Uncharacterized protein n=1 Tax=Spraguea lophii (strain 42_110) TaxID=1358809 RepID=S7XJ25_SPRLO|nr:hypothetical protein SLOPH_1749 [Spraguea lophii 42_110]
MLFFYLLDIRCLSSLRKTSDKNSTMMNVGKNAKKSSTSEDSENPYSLVSNKQNNNANNNKQNTSNAQRKKVIISGPNHHYMPTKWDPSINKLSEMVREDIVSNKGFLENHTPEDITYNNAFGDISIFTINLFKSILTEKEIKDMSITVETMLDHGHPTVFCIQGVRKQFVDKLVKVSGTSHYSVTATKRYDIDTGRSAHMYFPIIFDKKVLTLVKSDFLSNQGHIYASYAKFKDKNHNNQPITIVNLDNSFVNKSVVDRNLSSLLADAIEDEEVKNNPLFIIGGIGTQTEFLKKLFTTGYKNSITEDNNNEGSRLTTVHGSNGMDDGIQRDYIITRDPNNVYGLAYSRILKNNFSIGNHYPVHAIYSYLPQTGNAVQK